MTITLRELVDSARQSAAARRLRLPEPELEARLRQGDEVGRPARRLRDALAADGLAIIAEVKGASPVDGPTRESFDPGAIAASYEAAGAAAISVLTEERHFRGSLRHLRDVSSRVDVPVLRKDFVVERYQVLEAAAAGAAAVLLIAEVLEGAALRELVEAAEEVGLDALVEIHDEASLERALESGSGLIGVNNRNLETMEIDLEHCLRMAGRLPADRVRVAESGVGQRADVERIEAAGYDAVLVGSSLMRALDPGRALRELLDGRRS